MITKTMLPLSIFFVDRIIPNQGFYYKGSLTSFYLIHTITLVTSDQYGSAAPLCSNIYEIFFVIVIMRGDITIRDINWIYNVIDDACIYGKLIC